MQLILFSMLMIAMSINTNKGEHGTYYTETIYTGGTDSPNETAQSVKGPNHPWLPHMCSAVQDSASEEFVMWCVRIHRDKVPGCTANMIRNTQREVNIDSAKKGYPFIGTYLEIHDCKWHRGKNPRKGTYNAASN